MNKKRFGFSLLSTTLMGLALVVSCTVTDGDGSDGNGSGDCTAGRSIPCTCANGDHGMQVCNSSGTGYGLCNCEGGGEAGATASGGADTQGGATAYGGEGYGGWTATAGAGGADVEPVVGGAGGAEAVGGAGGAAGGAPGLCEAQTDPCESCYHQECCTELTACLAVEQCVNEFIVIRECSNAEVDDDGNATPAEVDDCAPGGGWPGTHAAETVALVDCMNGGVGWESHVAWQPGAHCTDECY